MNLDKFYQSANLHNASLDFFINTLNIKITAFDSKPIAVADFFKDPKKLATTAVQNIAQLYIIGLVDDKTLNSQKSDIETVADAIKISKDYNGLILAAIALKNTPTRSQVAELTRLVNRSFPYLPVTIIFRYENKISFANAERVAYLQPWREGEKVGKISMLKDIDIAKPHGAHQKILNELQIPKQVSDFDGLYKHWQKILNTKELNKKFFKKIANWYFWSVAKSKFPYEYLRQDEKYKTKTNAELQELANQKATIRFITRIIFVWFLKEKKLIPENLFDKEFAKSIIKDANNKNSSNYYNAILQNLFFATLNRKADIRDFAENKNFHANKSTYDMNSFFRYEDLYLDPNPATVMQRFEKIPFINGGLFDCLDIKPDAKNNINAEIIDGFSRNKVWQAKMPDYLFFEKDNIDFNTELNEVYATKKGKYEVKGLFEIFEEYKFTVEENTPLEVDVALDPYLLGEIFENLLAYYNPETGATARKGSGSFYTPQEIVNYMVDESLLAYLKPITDTFENTNKTDGKSFNFNELQNLQENQKLQLVNALAKIKILDPACGSGAFPMGVLYRMVDILKSIDPTNNLWRQAQHDKLIGDKIKELAADTKAIEGLSDNQVKQKALAAVKERLQDLETNFDNEHHFDDYTRKLYIIQNSIYGVDIQDVAIQISKLRFFLSLIIDQKNDDIQPLPNLETKFVIANTLIGIDLPKFTIMGEEDHSQDQVKQLKEELKHIREQHFNATDKKTKDKLRQQDKAKREQIANSLADSMNSYKQEDLIKLKNEIATQKQYLAAAELMPDMVQEIIVKDLFGGESLQKVNYRKERIKECNLQIRLIENKLAAMQTNSHAETIRAQALQIAQWDIYNQNASATWFDMDWMFGITDGFDIVIGNPPYVQKPKGIYSKTQFPFSEEKDKGKQNLYKVFVENSYNLLKENGVATMIVQSSLMCDVSSQFTRELLLTKTTIKEILEFPKKAKTKEGQVFDNVLQGTCIYNFTKTVPKSNQKFNVSIDNDVTTIFKLKYEQLTQQELISIYPNGYFIPLVNENDFEVIQKLNSNSKPLIEYIKSISQGDINLTSESKYFSNKNSETVLLRGKHTHKYSINYDNDEFIQNNHKSNVVLLNQKVIHFVCQQITGTTDKYRLHFAITSKNKKFLFGNSVNKFSLRNESYNLFILAILNSKLMDWYFRKTSTNNHVNGYEIEQLPIIIPSEKVVTKFERIVNLILIAKKSNNIADHDTSLLEKEIDVMVYHLYELNYEEAKIIDNDLKEIDFYNVAP